jgi:hypothetical protein
VKLVSDAANAINVLTLWIRQLRASWSHFFIFLCGWDHDHAVSTELAFGVE